MRRFIGGYSLGILSGILVALVMQRYLAPVSLKAVKTPDVCYSCFWDIYGPKLRGDLVEFYRQYQSPDPLVQADSRYILWRATGSANCDVLSEYERIAKEDPDAGRKFVAASIYAFGAEECGLPEERAFLTASANAGVAGLPSSERLLRRIAAKNFSPTITRTPIETSIHVPKNATRFVLGQTSLEITPHSRIGTQVERVARDWISYQMRWSLDQQPLTIPPLNYHEGAFVAAIQKLVPVNVLPLTGSIAVRHGRDWFAPDETGTFRFMVLDDKIEYPTTHVRGTTAWIEDTHGISALVPQAIDRQVDIVIGCGDSEGKAEAALYLAQKGIHVIFPGDRYQDELLGYEGKGVLLGGAPVHSVNGHTFVGAQPIAFSLREKIVVEDTGQPSPIQYYDGPARYFRKLGRFADLNLEYVLVDDQDQLYRVLNRARELRADVVAVRVMTQAEDAALRAWLTGAPGRRAVLFHSGLYPYAQQLFSEFPRQVTFGDLHPQFE
jgi:hypothetical protein